MDGTKTFKKQALDFKTKADTFGDDSGGGTAQQFQEAALAFMIAANSFKDAAESLCLAVLANCKKSKTNAQAFTNPASTFKENARQFKSKAAGITGATGQVETAIQKFQTAAAIFGNITKQSKDSSPKDAAGVAFNNFATQLNSTNACTTGLQIFKTKAWAFYNAAAAFATQAGNFYTLAGKVRATDPQDTADLENIKDKFKDAICVLIKNIVTGC